ncbi:hypothetical protein J4Q44_G00238800 [Coregonus suidteri]|uniref:Uncharacterized protein n=1 Tax=Coregonus suidteri TaxID=861788 RepID=A0AAN8L984_9TELE
MTPGLTRQEDGQDSTGDGEYPKFCSNTIFWGVKPQPYPTSSHIWTKAPVPAPAQPKHVGQGSLLVPAQPYRAHSLAQHTSTTLAHNPCPRPAAFSTGAVGNLPGEDNTSSTGAL